MKSKLELLQNIAKDSLTKEKEDDFTYLSDKFERNICSFKELSKDECVHLITLHGDELHTDICDYIEVDRVDITDLLKISNDSISSWVTVGSILKSLHEIKAIDDKTYCNRLAGIGEYPITFVATKDEITKLYTDMLSIPAGGLESRRWFNVL